MFSSPPQTYTPVGSSTVSPAVQQVQSQGRNNDTMLVHMTPGEVGGLQNLAMAHGGSLTVNPETGLPEAGFLEDILPTILGFALTPLTGGLINPLTAGALVGAGTGLATGSLEKGLMAGLGAFGGASLAGAAGLGALGAGAADTVAATALPGAVGADAASLASAAATPAATAGLPGLADASLVMGGAPATTIASAAATPASLAAPMMDAGLTNIAGNAATALSTPTTLLGKTLGVGAEQFGNRFAAEAGRPLWGSAAGTPTALKTGAAASGLAMPVMSALSPTYKPVGTPEEKSNYDGPYLPAPRTARFRGKGHPYGDSSEFQYFDNVNPYPNIVKAPKPGAADYNIGYADGGEIGHMRARQGAVINDMPAPPQGRYRFDAATGSLIDAGEPDTQMLAEGGLALEDGAFVVDARTVSELGNGSSGAGQELLSRMGGRPIHGEGDGVSDSVEASIGGTQEARVARDEVHFSPEAVKRIGGGNPKKGADKLYSLMNKAHTARKKAKRGEDTGLRALLGAQK
jgi:hypothetical protein